MPIITTTKGKYRGAEFVHFLIRRRCHFPYFQRTFAKRGKHLCFFRVILSKKMGFLVISIEVQPLKMRPERTGCSKWEFKNKKLEGFSSIGFLFIKERKRVSPHIHNCCAFPSRSRSFWCVSFFSTPWRIYKRTFDVWSPCCYMLK